MKLITYSQNPTLTLILRLKSNMGRWILLL